ncbi:hypothetical protein CDLVIII_3200 [Clostridium sp. DL-VIII]|uniref:hypothetical protein n=1 Tax=Clostridium sp. DL-VIII TaxID=641107 RepID=UPI00023AFFCD|nr:hypothetical protein [Clostridium sp. DL-VIII]EHI99774.1 hypothetical protein CDLVIII_3200 [Clostridium sp. DL-VIII]
MDIIEYRKTSLAFRRVASNMLTTDCKEGNIQLIRFRMFIQEDKIISRIISKKIKDIEYDYKKDFIICPDGDYWNYINIPIDESKHIKAMYDYLIDITKEEKDLRGIASSFQHSSNTWNDIVRSYLDMMFKPLVDFIVDNLSMEMIAMEPGKNETHIHQSINNNYGTANIAERDIYSINNSNANSIQDIINLISDIKKNIEEINEIEEDSKEEVMDDLDVIQEQVKSENPKYIKLKKAYSGIKRFITKLPQNIGIATMIVTKLNELGQNIEPIIEKIKDRW